jgi:hypothetical protein
MYELKERCREWKMRPRGFADDAMWARSGSGFTASIADEFMNEGVVLRPARKADRVSGWEILRRMMSDARSGERPGFYASRACEYFWQTVPYLGRDPRKANDCDSRGPDHAADAVRYGVLAIHNTFTQMSF